MKQTDIPVAVLMGSDSDLEVMTRCVEQLRVFGIGCDVRILSAHRTPRALDEYVAAAPSLGVRVFIAAAGMSAALAGTVAGRTHLPVIGVAMASGTLGGIDALLSTVQMPPGVPVACTGMGAAGAINAAVLAAEILALSEPELAGRLARYRSEQADKTLAKNEKLAKRLGK